MCERSSASCSKARPRGKGGGLEPDQKELFPPTTARLSSGGPLWKFSLFLLWYTQVQQVPDCNWLFKTEEGEEKANGIKGETSYLHLEENRRRENNMLMRFFPLSSRIFSLNYGHTYSIYVHTGNKTHRPRVSGSIWSRELVGPRPGGIHFANYRWGRRVDMGIVVHACNLKKTK